MPAAKSPKTREDSRPELRGPGRARRRGLGAQPTSTDEATSLAGLSERIRALDARLQSLAEELEFLRASWGWLELRLDDARAEALTPYV